MSRFLDDFEEGKAEGRYVTASLPSLPFEGGQFDLALCSHLLFLYSDQLSLDFHQASIEELLSVASEVRLFPLLSLDRRPSPHFDPLVMYIHSRSRYFSVAIRAKPAFAQGYGGQARTGGL